MNKRMRRQVGLTAIGSSGGLIVLFALSLLLGMHDDGPYGVLLHKMVSLLAQMALGLGFVCWAVWRLGEFLSPLEPSTARLKFFAGIALLVLFVMSVFPFAVAPVIADQRVANSLAATEDGTLPSGCARHLTTGQVERLWQDEDEATTYIEFSQTNETLGVPISVATGVVVGEDYLVTEMECTAQVLWAERTRSAWSLEAGSAEEH